MFPKNVISAVSGDGALGRFATITATNSEGGAVGPIKFSYGTAGIDPPGTPEFIIPANVTTWDGAVEGVQPGDTIQIAAGTRGPLRINNVVGVPGNPVLIRSDPAGQTIIRRSVPASGDFVFRIRNCQHFILDGSTTTAETYGIKVMYASTGTTDAPTAWIQLWGICDNYRLTNIHIDGGYLTFATRGIGLQHNDASITEGQQPWRENIIVENCMVQDVFGEGLYIGPNYSNPWSQEVPTRNVEVRYNDIQRCGRDGCQIKSSLEGDNSFHHNFVMTTGLRDDETQGGQKLGFGFFEGSGSVYNNTIIDAGEHAIQQFCLYRPNTFSLPPFIAYNNVIVRPGARSDAIAQPGDGIQTGAANTGRAIPNSIRIYMNTIIQSEAEGIDINSSISSNVFISNNIISESGTGPIADNSTGLSFVVNNETGSVASQLFVNAGNDDYHLTAGSPARDSAVTGITASTDRDDVVRPQGTDEDQGAYEFV